MKKPHMKPEEKRYVNLQTLVTLGEQKRLLKMIRSKGGSISNVLRDGLRIQLAEWEKQCESAK